MTNEELKQKCLEYDKHFGTRRESEYEGFGVYDFITTGDKSYFAANDGSLERWEKDLENFTPKITMEINGYHLKMTCEACPEQYDVFKDGEQVGYLRLRHGYFTAETPKCGGKMVYESYPAGSGSFHEDERSFYLTGAIKAIDKNLNPE